MLEIGSVVDNKYKILNEVGHGGMSVVYLAMNEKANKQWAIKEVRKDGVKDFEVVKQSLVAETDMLKRLSHPNLPDIIDVIESDERFLIVMDYIQGNSLSKALEEFGAQQQDEVIKWAKQLCDVLGYLHSRKPAIIYRDLKPANIMLKPDGNITLIDFGTAREYKEKNLADTTCLGTVGYAAPEQFGGMGQTDARTDIYCLGATLYHLVTGMNPCEPPYEILPIRQVNPALSSGLERIIKKCTQSDPNNRYQSAEELMYALEHYEEIDDIYKKKQKRKLRTFIASIVLMGASIGLSVFGYKAAQNKQSENYDLILASANSVDDYYEAIITDPTRTDAYFAMNEFLINDFELSKEEGQQLIKLLTGLDSKNSRGFSEKTDALTSLKEYNYSGYVDVCYEFGSSFLYYYDADISDKDRYDNAARWFVEAKADYAVAEIYYDISNCLDLINQYNGAKIKQTEKMYEQYQNLWGMITELKSKVENFEEADSKLQCWKEINKIINSNITAFLEIENKNDVTAVLNDIVTGTKGINNSILEKDIAELQDSIANTLSRIESVK